MSGVRVIVGLGNPGARYAYTRHNAGFMLVDALAEGALWKSWPGGLGDYLVLPDFILAKPLTYMNESGRFVTALLHFYKIPPSEVLVCFDDMSIPLGQVRLREQGSSGGHNGMRSVFEELKTDKVPRLRLGIGPRPPMIDGASFVLGTFAKEERPALDKMISLAKEAVLLAVKADIACAMSRYNTQNA